MRRSINDAYRVGNWSAFRIIKRHSISLLVYYSKLGFGEEEECWRSDEAETVCELCCHQRTRHKSMYTITESWYEKVPWRSRDEKLERKGSQGARIGE